MQQINTTILYLRTTQCTLIMLIRHSKCELYSRLMINVSTARKTFRSKPWSQSNPWSCQSPSSAQVSQGQPALLAYCMPSANSKNKYYYTQWLHNTGNTMNIHDVPKNEGDRSPAVWNSPTFPWHSVALTPPRSGSSPKILAGDCSISPFITESIFSVRWNRKNTNFI